METLEMTPVEKLQKIEDLLSQVKHGRNGKVIKAVADRAGKSRVTVKLHWFCKTAPSVPEDYRDMAIEELEKEIEQQKN